MVLFGLGAVLASTGQLLALRTGQSFKRPNRYRLSRTLETMPSRLTLQALAAVCHWRGGGFICKSGAFKNDHNLAYSFWEGFSMRNLFKATFFIVVTTTRRPSNMMARDASDNQTVRPVLNL